MLTLLLLFAVLADTPSIRVHTSGAQNPGYFLISAFNKDSAGLVDNSGTFVHALQTGPNINQHPTPYRGYTYFDGLLRAYIVVDENLRLQDTFTVSPPYTTDFHEGYQTRGRRYLVLGTETRTIDLSHQIQGASDSAQVIGAVIQEIDRRGRITFEWKSLDHIPVTVATPDIDLTHNRIDYLHANAITEDPSGDILLSCRNADQIIKIDRNTGSIEWVLGGSASQRNDFTFINDTVDGFVGFSHQHDPLVTKEGEILLFDNGNLKSSQQSRVVAYKIDPTLMTATKTWEYTPAVPTFAPTMGSVQQLENGNILIGWGTTQNGLIATEVSRDGTIHAEITAAHPLDFPYRVYKAPIAMTAVTKTITNEGLVAFTTLDSTTKFSLLPNTIQRAQTVTIERHTYPPTSITHRDTAPCQAFPERWVVMFEKDVNDYSAFIDVSRTIAEEDPSAVRVYYRPKEGTGDFVSVPTTQHEQTSLVKINSVLPGEYMLGSQMCAQPALVYPNNQESQTTTTIPLSWTGAIGADGYEVEISTSPDFSKDVLFLRTRLPDTTIKNLATNTTYYWHVRVVKQPEVGPWTHTWMFNIMAPTTIKEDGELHTLPVGSSVFVYDVLGNEISRETITQEQQRIAPFVDDRLLLIVAKTPTGSIVRTVISR